MIELQKLLDEHRAKALVSCPPMCFCWDAEEYITQQQAAAQPAGATRPTCRICGIPIYESAEDRKWYHFGFQQPHDAEPRQ